MNNTILRPLSRQPMPPEARKVFEGVVFDVYQWPQTLYNGSIATFEKLKRRDTAVVYAVQPDGRILLTRQEQPGIAAYIGAAGGQVEDGEDVIVAAARELLEETGYKAGSYHLWNAVHPTSKIDWVVYTLVAHGAEKVAQPDLDDGEKIETMLVTFDEFLELACEPGFAEREVLPQIVEARYNPQKRAELAAFFAPR